MSTLRRGTLIRVERSSESKQTTASASERVRRHVVYDSKASETNDPECAGPVPPCRADWTAPLPALPPGSRRRGKLSSSRRTFAPEAPAECSCGPLTVPWLGCPGAAQHGMARGRRQLGRHGMPERWRGRRGCNGGGPGPSCCNAGPSCCNAAQHVATQRNVSVPGRSYCDDAWPCHYFPAVFLPHFKVRPPARQSTPSTCRV